jgi:hypothetical protein
MLKKITFVALFVVSMAVGASSSVFAHSAVKAPVLDAPQGLRCPGGMAC